MNSIVNHKYDHRQHVLSDWLAELEQRFQLGEVDTDKSKITWCQLLIGATGSSILSGLQDDASWETAKETLLSRLGIGSVKDAALKQLKRGSKEIVELAGKAEKLAKQLHPRDEEAAERHAIDSFLSALDRPLAAEVQKLGCRTMEDVVTAVRRIERILGEQSDSKMDRLILSMQDQIRILTKDLKSAHEQMATQSAPATPTAALACRYSGCRSSASSRPATSYGCRSPASSRSATITSYRSAASIPSCSPPVSGLWGEGPYFRPPRRQQDRRSPRCFLCGKEGHFVTHCPARSVLQRLLHQQPREPTRGSPRGQVLELPAADDSQGHLNC